MCTGVFRGISDAITGRVDGTAGGYIHHAQLDAMAGALTANRGYMKLFAVIFLEGEHYEGT